MKILIVDDTRTLRDLLRMELLRAGYEVEQAGDGHEALSVLAKSTPRLIITDFNMPNMNGIDLVKSVRSTPKIKYIPIIMLTTETSSEKRNMGKEAGVTAWLPKPFDKDILLDMIDRIIL
ncbi:response regulator [Neokomagataea thailandica]|uniref:Chemotaxis protein CheY n=1 Tax=Neokomagataea tanensis NBRC 106556 TaxID=1223519 RepID=A0ABQ0QL91_9PROT|nr:MULTISPECIES: response regulator [Neokomagataea]GBR49048.1 chemotaxis protein CheY [Neokomagataea tanensis NBRC 106556]